MRSLECVRGERGEVQGVVTAVVNDRVRVVWGAKQTRSRYVTVLVTRYVL